MTSRRTFQAAALAFALAAFCATAFAQDIRSKFDPSRDAAKDLAAAVATAKAQGKRVIVDVGGEWCTWCHIMDRFVLSSADVNAHLFVLIADGKMLHSQETGSLEAARDYDKGKFVAFLEKYGNK